MQGNAAAGNVPAVPDFKRLFESGPNLYLVLTPQWIIVAVSDALLRATRIKREDVIGRHALDVYPANPADLHSQGPNVILESMQRVIDTGRPDVLPFQRYDIARPACEGGRYEERHWSIVNAPIFDDHGRVEFILERCLLYTSDAADE